MTGTFVAVVGPSGVGKDSLLGYAQQHLGDRVALVRRVVTRKADGRGEDHDELTQDAFEAAEQAGEFLLSWSAHGLRYGLPLSLIDDLEVGKIVLANLSRQVVPALIRRIPTALVVEVTARPEIIAQRLFNRGRESSDVIAQRLTRSVADVKLPASTIRLDNSGPLHLAGDHLVALLVDLNTSRISQSRPVSTDTP